MIQCDSVGYNALYARRVLKSTRIKIINKFSRWSTSLVYHSLSQYISLYLTISQFISVYLTISQFISVYPSISQFISIYCYICCKFVLVVLVYVFATIYIIIRFETLYYLIIKLLGETDALNVILY